MVPDLYDGKLAGFAEFGHMGASLVTDALEHANTVHGGPDDAIFHSDYGSM